jgi:hypothetical protein
MLQCKCGVRYFRVGSSTDLTAPKSDFRFTPESGLKSDIRPCPVRANTGSDAQPISAVAPLRVAIRGIGNRGADANAGAGGISLFGRMRNE